MCLVAPVASASIGGMRTSGRLIGQSSRHNMFNGAPSSSSSDFLLLSNGLDYVNADYSHLPISQRPLPLLEKLKYVTTTPTDMISPWMGCHSKQSGSSSSHKGKNVMSVKKVQPPGDVAHHDTQNVCVHGHVFVPDVSDLSSNRLTIDGRRPLCQGVDTTTPCPPYCNCCNTVDKRERYNNPWTDVEKVRKLFGVSHVTTDRNGN